MDGALNTATVTQEVYTLLGVRQDGVASVVDLVDGDLDFVRRQAEVMLREHASCQGVEIWRAGGLMEKLARA